MITTLKPKSAFFVADGYAALIANDIFDLRYRAEERCVPPGMQTPCRCDAAAETQLIVTAGTLEFMVGGATAPASKGEIIRVPPGASYAYRNLGSDTARLLVRTVRPVTPKRGWRMALEFAA